jgi:eukaryotic-like serine/threonine-protein kinase
MLSGQVPFPGAHTEAIIHSILTAKPKPLKQLRPEVPAEIERVIYRALEKDLPSRYAFASEVWKDLTDYQSSLALPKMELGGWTLLSGWIRQKRVAIPCLLILLFLGSLLGWLFHRQAKVRWAREEALPEIRRLIDEEKYMAAFTLAQQVEKYIPTDSRLPKLWPAMSSIVSIQTSPPGADVSMKEYSTINGGWRYLGQSPLDRIRIPFGGVQLKAEKKSFAKVETVEGPWTEGSISLKLDPDGSLPAEMVHALSGSTPVTLNLPGLDHLEPVQLSDYWIDKYEVTNKQFKGFVDQGGYEKQKYWKPPFVKGGHEISWSQAMDDFHDTTGRPGPSTWEMGNYPPGLDDYPVSGVSWYEAAAYAEFVGKSLQPFTIGTASL